MLHYSPERLKRINSNAPSEHSRNSQNTQTHYTDFKKNRESTQYRSSSVHNEPLTYINPQSNTSISSRLSYKTYLQQNEPPFIKNQPNFLKQGQQYQYKNTPYYKTAKVLTNQNANPQETAQTQKLFQSIIQRMRKQLQQKYKNAMEQAGYEIDRLTNLLTSSKSENKILMSILDKMQNENKQLKEEVMQLSEVENQVCFLKQKVMDKQNVIKVLLQKKDPESTDIKRSSRVNSHTSSPVTSRNLLSPQPLSHQKQKQLLLTIQKQKKLNEEKNLIIEELVKKINSLETLANELIGNNADIIHEVSEMLQVSNSTGKNSNLTEQMFSVINSTKFQTQKQSELPLNSIKKLRRNFATEIESQSPQKNSSKLEQLQMCLGHLKQDYFDAHREKTAYINDRIRFLQEKIQIIMSTYSRICEQIVRQYEQKESYDNSC